MLLFRLKRYIKRQINKIVTGKLLAIYHNKWKYTYSYDTHIRVLELYNQYRLTITNDEYILTIRYFNMDYTIYSDKNKRVTRNRMLICHPKFKYRYNMQYNQNSIENMSYLYDLDHYSVNQFYKPAINSWFIQTVPIKCGISKLLHISVKKGQISKFMRAMNTDGETTYFVRQNPIIKV